MTLTPEVQRGPYQGHGIIGDVTEAMHAFLQESWPEGKPPPRVVEDLSFEPKDREEVVYVYMYRVARNAALQNPKRWRKANVALPESDPESESDNVLYARPPLYLDLFYLVTVHARFRSDAERLLGWTLLRLNEATHLIYRPRRYLLPDGRAVDSNGRPWNAEARGDDVIMEKVSVAMVDDLTIGDAVHFFNIHEASYRPYVTFRARCAMEGSLVQAPPTVVRSLPARTKTEPALPRPGRAARARLGSGRAQSPFGPPGTPPAPISDNDDED